MAGRKKGNKAKGPAKAAPRRRPQQRTSSQPQSQQPHMWATQATQQASFSLADEARWMATHRSHAFDTDRRLRDRKIAFVSAGYLEGTIKENKNEGPYPIPGLSSPSPATPPQGVDPDMDPLPRAPANAIAKMTIQSPIPSASDSSSSEDEVIFRGRAVPPNAHSAIPATDTASQNKASSTTVESHLHGSIFGSSSGIASGPGNGSGNGSGIGCGPGTASGSGTDPVPVPEPVVDSDGGSDDSAHGDSVNEQLFTQRLGGESKWMVGTQPWVSRSKPDIGWLPVDDRPDMNAFLAGRVKPEDAAMEDYMQNIRDSIIEDEPTASSSSFAHRPLDIGDDDNVFLPKPDIHQSDNWDSDMLRDLDDLSTSSDVGHNIERIVATRKRRSGVQYLVVYEGSTTDDTHWLPISFFKTEQDLALVQVFETRRSRYDAPSDFNEDSSSNENGSDDSDDDDGQDYEDMAAEGESDEAYAMRLQKELDYGVETGVMYGEDIFISHQARSGPPWANSRSRNNDVTFPSASALADAIEQDPYDGFDIMDTQRPSLRPKKKGRRGQMPPEIADPELNEQLQMSWENDRTKKRLRKAEREELRKLGQLGRKGKGPDLSVKYKHGADLKEVTEEIREFLFSDMNTLSLPPMEANSRAVIHQFVKQLGLSSKSRGKGANRFTVISKTLRTIKIDDEDFDAIAGRRQFKSRLQGSTRSGPRSRPVVSYKDGETVGASAPELGPENKGRRLLEKMGWTKGTALGAVDNKGILQPIAHTVKTTKAGLQ